MTTSKISKLKLKQTSWTTIIVMEFYINSTSKMKQMPLKMLTNQKSNNPRPRTKKVKSPARLHADSILTGFERKFQPTRLGSKSTTSISIWPTSQIVLSLAVSPQRAQKRSTVIVEATSWDFCKRITVIWSKFITCVQSHHTNTLQKVWCAQSENSHFLTTTSPA